MCAVFVGQIGSRVPGEVSWFREYRVGIGAWPIGSYNFDMIDLVIALWPLWAFLTLLLAIIFLTRMWAGSGKLPYEKRPRLVTKAELRFYKSLMKAVQDDWEIFAMVRIADILVVKKDTPKRRTWLNKILAKHIDFVLCDPGSLEVRVAIELDDSSHQRKDRQERDEFVDHAFESAGLPLIRFPVKSSYHSREIREIIDKAV